METGTSGTTIYLCHLRCVPAIWVGLFPHFLRLRHFVNKFLDTYCQLLTSRFSKSINTIQLFPFVSLLFTQAPASL